MSESDHTLPFREVAQARLEELCAAFPLGYTPRILWRPYRVSAGLAYYRKGEIGLSTRILNDEVHVIETLVHEYAHLLAVARYGQKGVGHGPPWQQAMIDLGQEPKVTHNFPVERNTVRQQVVYRCRRCQKLIIRSRRLPRKQRYVHAHCGGDLKFERVEPITTDSFDT